MSTLPFRLGEGAGGRGREATALAATALAALWLAGCAPGTEEVAAARSSIEGGELDARDEGVVGVLTSDAAGAPRRVCTGTLIAPNLVLTAQHCIAETRRVVDCRSSAFGSAMAPGRIAVTTSPSIWGDGADWTAAAEVLTPPDGPALCGRDVAMIVLDAPIRGAAPLAPRLDETARERESYAAVGFGASRDHARDGGTRRRRERLSVLCVGSDCGTRQIDEREWRGDHGICNGDSGGPAIDEDGLVIGVTSRGPASCERPIYGAVAPHASWIREGARRAALRGDYREPAWANDTGCAAPDADMDGGRACAAARPGTDGGRAPWGVAAALVACLAARRRR